MPVLKIWKFELEILMWIHLVKVQAQEEYKGMEHVEKRRASLRKRQGQGWRKIFFGLKSYGKRC